MSSAWKWAQLRDRERALAGTSYKSLNRRQLDEEGTAILLSDCRRQPSPTPSQQTLDYRKQYGIIFPEQLMRIHNREFLVATVDYIHEGTGMYFRSHPEGRKVNPPDLRAKGAGFYR